jgi:YD repeat-containing protein
VGTAGPVSAYGHAYDARGDLSRITELNQIKAFTYDPIGRLTGGGTTITPTAWTYGAEGNRTLSS